MKKIIIFVLLPAIAVASVQKIAAYAAIGVNLINISRTAGQVVIAVKTIRHPKTAIRKARQKRT